MLRTEGATMKVYNIDEMCDLLKLKPPVLRKYSALLEESGYKGINRNNANARYYTQDNVMVFRELISYKNSGHMTLNDATKAIVARIHGIDVVEVVTQEHIEQLAQRSDVEAMKEAVTLLLEFLQQQDSTHNQRHADLLSEIKELREEVALMKDVAPVEEVAATSIQKKPSFWRGIFRTYR